MSKPDASASDGLIFLTRTPLNKIIDGPPRHCKSCLELKEASEFYWRKATESYCGVCSKCINKPRRKGFKRPYAFIPVYTKDDLKKIRRMIKSGKYYDEIMEEFGWTFGRISYIIRKNKLPYARRRKQLTVINHDLLEKIRVCIHELRLSNSKTGGLLGLTKNQVAGYVWRFGINDLTSPPKEFKRVNASSKFSRPRKTFIRKARRVLPSPSTGPLAQPETSQARKVALQMLVSLSSHRIWGAHLIRGDSMRKQRVRSMSEHLQMIHDESDDLQAFHEYLKFDEMKAMDELPPKLKAIALEHGVKASDILRSYRRTLRLISMKSQEEAETSLAKITMQSVRKAYDADREEQELG